ncbi:hypothetical protein DASC09_046230 [Saccharomycopsis crataegensis]|uniref:Uncharacterized protein n=1 Tax=Saccharomycopsis crataegensis TaxID=43959 RepID=A0AAV5QR82_9ASCO|nr:hypothetical protein DASC09_046230 [Saccharomycopsis crataegensis]
MALRNWIRSTISSRSPEYLQKTAEVDAALDNADHQNIVPMTETLDNIKQKPARLEGVTEIPDSSAYVANLATTPALAAVNGMISSFPIPKIFTSNAIPLLMYMRDNNQAEKQKAGSSS